MNLYVPKYLAVTLGFDTARRLLSEVAGNIFVDSLSSNKWPGWWKLVVPLCVGFLEEFLLFGSLSKVFF